MVKVSIADRLLLFGTGLLAAYQIVVGIEGLATLAVASYTAGFGVILVAALLMIVLGFEILDSPLVVIVSTVIPLSISMGLIIEYYSDFKIPYFIFLVLGLLAITVTRLYTVQRIASIILSAVHAVAGTVIVILPILLARQGRATVGILWLTLGGTLMGIGGMLLAFFKAGKPVLPQETILRLLPVLLLLTSTSFVLGFTFR